MNNLQCSDKKRIIFNVHRPGRNRFVFRYPASVGLFVCLCAGSLLSSAQPRPGTVPPDFKGRLLLALSDADMVASGYADGKLGAPAGDDELSAIRLGGRGTNALAGTVQAGNSVTGPPAPLAVSPDGKYAFVVETLGSRPLNQPDATMKDLAPGHAITVVDLADPARPRTVQRLRPQQQRPVSVCINSAGNTVVVSYDVQNGVQKPLVIYQFSGGKLLSPAAPAIPGWGEGDNMGTASFYIDNILALVNIGLPSLSFVRVTGTDSSVRLTSWGNRIGLDKAPFLVRFTTDGRFALCNSMYFGADVAASPRGTIASIRIEAAQAADGSPVHLVVSHTEAGYGPEGMAVSPDGRWVVTANLEQSWEPLESPHQTLFSSLTLLRLDTAGRLDKVRDFTFNGILPETVVFDASSRYVAITTYDHYADMPAGGSIDFWRLGYDYHEPLRVELVKTGYSVPVKRGVHSMVLVQ